MRIPNCHDSFLVLCLKICLFQMKIATTQRHKLCALNLNANLMNFKCTWPHECTFTVKKSNSIVSDLCCVASTATNAAVAAAAAEQS